MQRHEIESAVTEMIKPHEDKWRQQVRDEYTKHAEHQHKRFTEYWSTVGPKEKIPHRGDYAPYGTRQAPPPSSFLTHPYNVPGAHELHPHYGAQVHAAKNGTVALDHKKIIADADADFETTRANFIARATDKLSHIAGAKPVARVSGALRMAGALQGHITGHIDDRNHFTLDVAMMDNYRYGENSANRNLTHYTQYPFRVLSAHVDGSHIPSPAADDLAVRWGGVPAATAERNRVTAARSVKAEWSRKKDELERHVDHWKAVHGAVSGHAERSANFAAATDPTHPRHKKLKREYDQSIERTFQMNPHLRDDAAFKAGIPPFEQTHPAPKALPALPTPKPERRYSSYQEGYIHTATHELGLTSWPTPEEAKSKLAQARAALADHKAKKP